MSACTCCPEHHEGDSANDMRMDYWAVTQYKCNHSSFGGYRRTPSDYSEVHCTRCSNRWRTKASYVERLPRSSERPTNPEDRKPL